MKCPSAECTPNHNRSKESATRTGHGSSYFGDSRLIAERAATERSPQWNNIVDEYTYVVLGALVGLVVLVLFFVRREEREYLWFSLLLLANALDNGLDISRLLALMPIPLYDYIDGSVQAAALFTALSGKGMPAAMTVSLIVGRVRILAHYTQSPGEILAAMNQRMLARSGGGFTTCLAMRLDAQRTLTAANAGHLAPYIDGKELALESGLPLGLDGASSYPELTFHLPPEAG